MGRAVSAAGNVVPSEDDGAYDDVVVGAVVFAGHHVAGSAYRAAHIVAVFVAVIGPRLDGRPRRPAAGQQDQRQAGYQDEA